MNNNGRDGNENSNGFENNNGNENNNGSENHDGNEDTENHDGNEDTDNNDGNEDTQDNDDDKTDSSDFLTSKVSCIISFSFFFFSFWNNDIKDFDNNKHDAALDKDPDIRRVSC